MAAEFHRKTSALFEEFKKRELHFLNTEANLNCSVKWKNNMSMPFQEYLQKINKREQETEKTYKDLMRQMDDLGKRTDQMTLNLEKLNVLRNVALSSNNSAWPATDVTYDRPFQSFYSNSLLQTTPKVFSTDVPFSDFPPRIQPDISFINHSYQHSSDRPSVTTQTEYIFCDNCHFPLILNSKTAVSNSNLPTSTTHKTISKENELNLVHNLSGTQEDVEYTREPIIRKSVVGNNFVSESGGNFPDTQVNDYDDSSFMNVRKSSEVADISLNEHELMSEQAENRMSESHFDNTIVDEQPSILVKKRMSENYTDNAFTDGLANELVQKRTSLIYTDNVFVDEQPNIPVQKRMSESYVDNAVTGDYITHTEQKQYVEIRDNDLLSNDGNFEQMISKSDDESMSHEFNFLDSDKSQIPKGQSSRQESGDTYNQQTGGVKHHGNNQLESSYAMQSNTDTHLLQVQQTSGIDEKGVSNRDISFSAGPPSPSAHSENTSVISESDSFSEKETPMTATAAYQALLGNVSAAKAKQRSTPISDSDSEDEIENALANAVMPRRTSHITFDAAVLDPKTEKRKESIAEIKTERNTKFDALFIFTFYSILCLYLVNEADPWLGKLRPAAVF